MNYCTGKKGYKQVLKTFLKMLKYVGMAVRKTAETRCRNGSVQARHVTTQVTPSLHLFLLQTATLNNLMACIAHKIITGIKKDVGMGLLTSVVFV